MFAGPENFERVKLEGNWHVALDTLDSLVGQSWSILG